MEMVSSISSSSASNDDNDDETLLKMLSGLLCMYASEYTRMHLSAPKTIKISDSPRVNGCRAAIFSILQLMNDIAPPRWKKLGTALNLSCTVAHQ